MAEPQQQVRQENDILNEMENPKYSEDRVSNPVEEPFNQDNEEKNLSESSRIGFIRKVYAILFCQLALTWGFVTLSCFNDSFKNYQQSNTWLYILLAVVAIICLYALGCYKQIATKVPTNYILLTIFTFSEAYVVSAIASQYSTKDVFIATGLTFGVVFALTLYACTTKTDFTMLGGMLFVCLLLLMMCSIFGIFFHSRWLTIVIAGLSLLLFGVYLIYDTQLIVGGKRQQLSIDEYVFAAIMLY